jgi:hypothetical protein
MAPDHDPVDIAFRTLRSHSGPATHFNPQLEEKLMQEFAKQQNRPRFIRRPAALAALAIVLVGGGAFAATGGVEKLKSWVFNVNVNGKTFTMVAADGQPATAIVETPDGRQATMTVQKTTDPQHGEMTNVQVTTDGDNSHEEKVIKVIKGNGTQPPESNYTMADLGDAKPVHEWTHPSGGSAALYILPGQEEGAIEIFVALTNEAGQTSVHKVASPTATMNLAGITPVVTVEKNGTISMQFDTGDGNIRVLKDRIAHHSEMLNEQGGPVQINDKTGEVNVNIDTASEKE